MFAQEFQIGNSGEKLGFDRQLKASKLNPEWFITLAGPKDYPINGQDRIWEAVRHNDVSRILQAIKEYKSGDFGGGRPNDIAYSTNMGNTLIHMAVSHRSLECLERLLEMAPNSKQLEYLVNGPNLYGVTPLHVAVFVDSPEHMNLLMSYGAEVDASGEVTEDNFAAAPIHKSPKVIAKLLQRDECMRLLAGTH